MIILACADLSLNNTLGTFVTSSFGQMNTAFRSNSDLQLHYNKSFFFCKNVEIYFTNKLTDGAQLRGPRCHWKGSFDTKNMMCMEHNGIVRFSCPSTGDKKWISRAYSNMYIKKAYNSDRRNCVGVMRIWFVMVAFECVFHFWNCPFIL